MILYGITTVQSLPAKKLRNAIIEDDFVTVQKLIHSNELLDIDEPDITGHTPLSLAVKLNRT